MIKTNEKVINLPDKLKKIEKWIILSGYRGSKAHDMYVPNTDPNSIDDIDLMYIVVPPEEYYLGLKEFGSRGTMEVFEGCLDIVVYEVKKLVSLLVKGNPNVLSLLWLDEYFDLTKEGKLLITNKRLFSTKNVYHAFTGYAYGQLKRMEAFKFEGYMGEKRKSLVEKYGFDCKNASHLIRLLRMAIEFLNTGELVVKRPDAEELLSIKKGGWSLEKIKKEAGVLFEGAKQAVKNSNLPDYPNLDKINELLIEIIRGTVTKNTYYS